MLHCVRSYCSLPITVDQNATVQWPYGKGWSIASAKHSEVCRALSFSISITFLIVLFQRRYAEELGFHLPICI